VIFGALALAVGAGACALAFLQIALAFLGPRAIGAAGGPRAAAAGAVVYAALGAAFVAAGIGSMARRRWAPPVVRVLSWAWLAGGLLTIAILPPAVASATAVASDGAAVPPSVLLAVQAVVTGLAFVFGVLFPAAFLWAYHDRDVDRTCRAHHLRPSWTDGRPASVLGLSLGFGALGVVSLASALHPAFPVFGALVTGPAAAAAHVATAILSGWLAVGLHGRRRAAWRVATAILVALGASAIVTLWSVPLERWYVALGQPPGLLPSDRAFSSLLAALTAALTVASVVYMLAVRRQFDA
jgi:hypothetical protein